MIYFGDSEGGITTITNVYALKRFKAHEHSVNFLYRVGRVRTFRDCSVQIRTCCIQSVTVRIVAPIIWFRSRDVLRTNIANSSKRTTAILGF